MSSAEVSGLCSSEANRAKLALIKEQTEIQIRLGLKISMLMMQESEKLPYLDPLLDGTIDPGDEQLISKHMMSFLGDIDEYREMLEFSRSRRKELASM